MFRNYIKQTSLGNIVDKGNFYPSAIRTPEVQRYESLTKGALICWNYASYYGGPWDTLLNKDLPPAPRTLVDCKNVDVDTWIKTLANQGFDYVVYTIQEEQGFSMWESRVPRNFAPTNLPTGLNGGNFISPRSPDGPFGIRSGVADTHILDKLVVACKKYKVELAFYMNLIGNIEVFNGQFSYNNHQLIEYPRYKEYIDYQCRLIQEILIRWPVNYLWYDKASPVSAEFSQATYNAAKAINSKVVIIGNHTGEYNFSEGRFPYDIGSTEEYSLFAGNTSYQTTTRTYNGQTYYVGQEFVLTPHLNSQWYSYDDLNVIQFPNKPYLQFQPKTDFQRLLDLAKEANRPVLVNILIDRQGKLVQKTLDYMSQLNFSRN
jgi:hypothetical protein